MFNKILISSLVINIGLLLGRFLGFFRESIFASKFGVTAEADVAVLVLAIPDLLVTILVGGGLSAALIPEFYDKKENVKDIFYQALLFFSIAFLIIVFVFQIHIDSFVGFLAPGFDSLQVLQSKKTISLILLVVPITVMTAIATAFLHSENRFGIASFGTVIVNSLIIFGLLIMTDNKLAVLSFSIILGVLLRFLSQFFYVIRLTGFPKIILFPWHIKYDVLIRYINVSMSGSLLLLFPLLLRAQASVLGEGGMAVMSYSYKLIELPIALTVTFLSIVLFPRLAKAFSVNKKEFEKIILWSLIALLLFSLVSLATIYPVIESLAAIVYQRGAINYDVIIYIKNIVEIGIFILPAVGFSTLITAIYNSKKDTLKPLLANLISLFVLIALLFLDESSSLEELMIKLVLAYAVNFIINTILFITTFNRVAINKFFLSQVLCLIILAIFSNRATDFIVSCSSNGLLSIFFAMLVGFFSIAIYVFFIYRNKFFKSELF